MLHFSRHHRNAEPYIAGTGRLVVLSASSLVSPAISLINSAKREVATVPAEDIRLFFPEEVTVDRYRDRLDQDEDDPAQLGAGIAPEMAGAALHDDIPGF